MEKGIESLAAYLKEEFQMGEVDIRTYSPLTLAYIGDAVYDLIIRTLVVERGNCPPHKLHKRTSQIVKAPAQAEMIERILPLLGGEEEYDGIYCRIYRDHAPDPFGRRRCRQCDLE